VSSTPKLLTLRAGIGRTGTFIALSFLYKLAMDYVALHQERFHEIPGFSVFGTVRALKEMRMGMVQTEIQYEFIYERLADFVQNLYVGKE
jgi:protein-tyrosine phosphatase